ncbi:hypothetical protein [Echinicola salinicaeni]|uniref:hypothetical protein n=1 Tax=Echinicola salinicaeni TaxID=2762757 RepID=UPI001646D098|nr:hypothetical protein [Echinicola salinicaeni]
MKRIKKFGVFQTAKVAAVIYTLISAIFFIPAGVITMLFSKMEFPMFGGGVRGIVFIFMPFVYGLIGFITVAIGCVVYNLISDKIGGIEVELEDSPRPDPYSQNYEA